MLVILDTRAPKQAHEALKAQGNTVLCLPPHPLLPEPTCSHPDMLLFFAPDAIYTTKSYQCIAHTELTYLEGICKRPLRLVDEEPGCTYPKDILLNALPLGKHLFCNTKHIAHALRTHEFYRLCHVNQGYAKCSAIPLGSSALITADPSIATAAKQIGADTLLVSAGSVELAGYDYGFLGGCTSFAPYGSTDRILFCGALDAHPDAKRVRDFCKAHGFATVSLGDFPLTDVGTIFLIE
ncbi:MAG: hypothetical protein IJW50_08410 [Clostridia bacterium]|nr:hypothetical protein [Clostridia bacterium]